MINSTALKYSIAILIPLLITLLLWLFGIDNENNSMIIKLNKKQTIVYVSLLLLIICINIYCLFIYIRLNNNNNNENDENVLFNLNDSSPSETEEPLISNNNSAILIEQFHIEYLNGRGGLVLKLFLFYNLYLFLD